MKPFLTWPFFTNQVHLKLGLPKAAQLSICYGKSVVLHFCGRVDLSEGGLRREREREHRKKKE